MTQDNTASCLADMITVRQLGIIRAEARSRHIDAEAKCEWLMKCKIDELSKRAANTFIDYLRGTGESDVN